MESRRKSTRAADAPRWGRGPLEIAAYFAAWPVLQVLARLPFGILYRLADAACFVLYRVLGVRRRVVLENLRGAFPDAAPEEIARLGERAFRNQCDVAVETVKLLVASAEEIASRVERDIDLARRLQEEGRSAIYVMGHNGNWEWAIPATAHEISKLVLHVVYHPLRHPGFERLFRAVRERFGVILSPMDDAPRAIVRLRRRTTAVILVADQRPRRRNPYTTTFLGRETTFLRGPERLARRLDMPVVFVEMKRVARGRYRLRAEWLCEEPATTSEGEITERFARRLERQILEAPEDWLWLHRRWRDRRAERAARGDTAA